MNLGNILETATLISAIFSILLILLQQRGASLGAGFGASGELYTTRRGLDKSLFKATIFFVLVFVLSILGLLIIPG
ncbi:preprotein translocase subunit SecG [Candidatus Saccharibacteria bacterium]|jgi:preprotein translocase subunit SecG|nr:preprotein translocase subunit SecG [Candidatus Saccharibacteria bacterium]